MLECRSLAAGYGALAVVRDLDLRVEPGEVVALLGPNGAGKTTTLLTLAGELPAISGEVGSTASPTKAPLHRRARRGLGSSPRSDPSSWASRPPTTSGSWRPADALELFPELEPLLGRAAGLLSGGEQQMLTLARRSRQARAPAVDELSLGLAPRVVKRLLAAVRRAATERSAACCSSNSTSAGARIADRAYVLQRGRIVMEGTVDEMRGRIDEVESTYLPGA